jgi:hypothetical protein
MHCLSCSIVESSDLAFCKHLPQIGASNWKLDKNPSPHWLHFKLYILPFGFQLLNSLIVLLIVQFNLCGTRLKIKRNLVTWYREIPSGLATLRVDSGLIGGDLCRAVEIIAPPYLL